MDAFLLLIAFAVILLGAELFTNAVEWLGHHLDLAEGAVGSVLAAVGTALPETMIPLVAIVAGGGGVRTDEIGLGAILGAPFMLSTLAMFVTGIAVLAYARRRPAGDLMPVDPGTVVGDLRTFALAYGLALLAAFVPVGYWWVRPLVGVLLVMGYLLYVRHHFAMERAQDAGAGLGPLRLHRLDVSGRRDDPDAPRLRIVGLQLVVALACIVGGAMAFVTAVSNLSLGLGIAPAVLSLVIAPLATELPEKANSVLWVRQGKDALAIGNLTGAMVFQACIPTLVALMLAPATWSVGPASALPFLSALIAFLSTAAVFVPMARRGQLRGRGLLVGGAFYVLFLACVVGAVGGLIPGLAA